MPSCDGTAKCKLELKFFVASKSHDSYSSIHKPDFTLCIFLTYSNGVLIDHYLTEVNGQNVIGLRDKDISEIFAESPRTLTITFMPAFVYDHMMKK